MKYYAQYNHTTGELSKANVKCLNAEVDNIEISKEWFENFDKCSYQDGQIVYNPDWVYVPTKEEQQQARQEAYKVEVDPITCHIQRLGDEEQTAEVIAEIAELVEERKAKVEEIKARYPYPDAIPVVEPIEEIKELPVVEEATVSETEKVDIVD